MKALVITLLLSCQPTWILWAAIGGRAMSPVASFELKSECEDRAHDNYRSDKESGAKVYYACFPDNFNPNK